MSDRPRLDDRTRGAKPRTTVTFGPWGIALLGAWVVAKQMIWSPLLDAGVPIQPGSAAADIAVGLVVVGIAVRLGGRARVFVLLALDAALTGLYQVQLLYERQFSDLASVATLAFASQSGRVHAAIFALARPTDLFLWADVLLLVSFAAVSRHPEPPRRGGTSTTTASRPTLSANGVANVLVAAGMLLFVAPAMSLVYRPLAGPRRLSVSRSEVAATVGIVGYQLFDAVRFAERRLHRSARASLPGAVAYHSEQLAPSGPLTGTQRGRNVIVVQLESLQHFAVGRVVHGVPVTPALDSLARESLVFTRAFTQAAQGTSSDAELAAGCSLYPLETGAVFTDRYDVSFRCLPEVLREAGYRTVAMHANWPNFWNRDRMYPAMGYQTFFSIRDFDREPVIGLGLSDARFFEQAVDRLAALPRPFYAFLVSLSNHAPFEDPNLPRALPLGELTGTYVGSYLESVHFADAALRILIERLRSTGLLDDSILVVYGDHAGVSRSASGTEQLELDLKRADVWLQHERRVPLLVRLPGGSHRALRDEPVGQIDIAPTLGDLLGIPFEDTFFHGRSLVSDRPRPVVLPDGSALSLETVFLAPGVRRGGPSCLDAPSGEPVAAERCDKLAAYAARELEISRAELDGDLFRFMMDPARARRRAW